MQGNFFYESANDRKGLDLAEVEPRSSFAVNQVGGVKSFNERFSELCEAYKQRNIDIRRDIDKLIGDRALMEEYRENLTGPVIEGYRTANPNDPHTEAVIGAFNTFWDNKLETFYNESSATIMDYLPINTLEFPVLTKQWYSSVMNDIIEVRSTKTPLLRRHVRTTYMVNNQTGEKLEYPRCMFDGTWKQMYDASRGYPIRQDKVMFDQGRIFNFDVIKGLTDGNPQMDKIGMDFKIVGIVINGGEVKYLRGNGITLEFSTGGTLVNGKIDTTFDGTHIVDLLSGQVDFENGTVSVASHSGQIEGVIFDGHLTNEKNLRSISVTEKREIKNFTVPSEGPRYSMPFSIEEIDDAKALLDIDYYQRMVDELVRIQEMNECQSVMQFLWDEFKKYQGIETDVLNLESFAKVYTVDLNPPHYYAGDPFDYMTKAIQFRLKSILHKITDSLKLEGISFVITGNPMACQLLAPFTEWKISNGTSMGGVQVNHSYGFATDMGANVRIVASNIYDAYSVDPVESVDYNGQKHSQRELVLHITGYPTDKEHISFEHIKYTSHIFTDRDSAYLSPQAPGGAYKVVMMTSRFTDITVQGIQADLVLLNSDRVYGPAPSTSKSLGYPWGTNVAPVAGL